MEITYQIADIDQVVEWLLKQVSASKCFAFHGEMGAGKTTFINAICKKLGVVDNISSPTFSIINEYYSADLGKLYHIDLYRLKDGKEAIAAGVEDCMYSGSYCFVEWPERAPELFPTETIHCFLSVIDSDNRKLKLKL